MSLVDIIAGHPAVYTVIQDLAGRGAIMRHLQPWLDQMSGRVLDVGGGTGRISEQLRADVRYLCLDLEREKLQRLRKRSPKAIGLLANGGALPFVSGTLDAALVVGVTHHLSDQDLRRVVAELSRVLVPSGRLIMLDALWSPRRLLARALWAWDRGSHPRTAEVLAEAFAEHFAIDDRKRFTVLHDYTALRCRNRRGE